MKSQEIIVVGSGFGGLAAAARLAAQGHRVSMYEKRDKLGGRAYQYEVDGFKFDGGPTVITAPYMFDEIWEMAGKRRVDYFQLLPLNPFYRIFDENGRHFDYWQEVPQVLDEIERWHPADVANYQEFVARTVEIFKYFHPYTEKPFLTLRDMLAIMPKVIGSGLYRGMHQYASQFIEDDFLRKVFSFHPLLIGGNPFDTPSLYGLIIQFEREWGVHYAVGGTGAIVDAFARLLRELGVAIHTSRGVDEIIVEHGRAAGVRLEDGVVHRADQVVSNADVAFTYRNLLADAVRPRLYTSRLSNMAYSSSLVVIYFGTRRRYLDSKLAHHNIIFGPRYRGLLRDIFNGRSLPDDFSLYLHMPTLTDPSIAPAGCESFYVLSLVPNLGAPIDWQAILPRYTDRVLGFLEEHYLPDLRQNIVAQHSIDPIHFRDTLSSYKGAAFGPKPTLMQSAWLRPHNRSDHFDNLYFVGAGTHPGAGVPAVMASGKIAADLIGEARPVERPAAVSTAAGAGVPLP